MRRTVKLIWTREEDIAQGMFRPQSYQCLEAATDEIGNVTGWKHCVVGGGEFLLIAGAISNAVYRLAGKRLRHLPFTPERVLDALKA